MKNYTNTKLVFAFTSGAWIRALCLSLPLFFFSCNPSSDQQQPPQSENPQIEPTLFRQVPSSASGINFLNTLTENIAFNYFDYNYLYNGGGVAIGDFDNDNLPDLVFTGNQVADQIYRNTGNLTFEPIPTSSGFNSEPGWKTGVSVIDINADGLLDIYICRSGPIPDPDQRRNLLFINKGKFKFTESATTYGLDDPAHSTQAYWLDYDQDGDIDMFLVNHRVDFRANIQANPELDNQVFPNSTDKLYQNQGNGAFKDVSESIGISDNSWGLSAAIGDFNEDGWPDIYVANDFQQPDKLYINQKNGRFKNELSSHFRHISFYSMGSDIADINNDGNQDLVVLDMVSEDHLRSKRMMASMNTDGFSFMVNNGYHYQYMANMLHLNHGNGLFSEIGQLAGISKTDWSWGPLIADFDLDGRKDLFVTNGIKRDVTDNDFMIKIRSVLARDQKMPPLEEAYAMMPSTQVPNYIFKNIGGLQFEKKIKEWGFSNAVNSNGAMYADLDNDGDLDLVTNNLEAVSCVYENTLNPDNYLSVSLKGPAQNPNAIGAKITISTSNGTQVQEVFPSRGFQSAGIGNMVFGIESPQEKGSILVEWTDGKTYSKTLAPGQKRLAISYEDAGTAGNLNQTKNPTFFKSINPSSLGIHFRHQENQFNDFETEILLPHKQSEHGPLMSTGDVNGDGLEDFFVGGAYGQAGELYLQNKNQTFRKADQQPWKTDIESEDLGSAMVDLDGDNDLDLYVVSGGNEYYPDDPRLNDRIYLNDGKGNFSKHNLPNFNMPFSGHRIASSDYNSDGQPDLFVGGRIVPGNYPLPAPSVMLSFAEGVLVAVDEKYPKGLITDAVFTDLDGDKDQDLVIVGEWMPIIIMLNENGTFVDATDKFGTKNLTGWWNRIIAADIDADGDMDLLVGNIGNNNKFHPAPEIPFHVYAADFDQSGSLDIVLAKDKNGIKLPVRGRECSSQQMPMIKTKFPTFQSFGEASLPDILGQEALQKALHYEANVFESVLLENNSGTGFTMKPLPIEAQFSAINDMICDDFNGDGHLDLLIAGNIYGAEVETIRYDASVGLMMTGNGRGGFVAVPPGKSGFIVPGNVKSMALVSHPNKPSIILVGNNNGVLQVFQYGNTDID